ncbi:general L-amino acid transport system permease protein [Paracoccus aminovorans]|uniref:General L-amino acid transport system permease protein n=1 Tax=Paracoccus aminovorans TaxID=34004 RepID=A0A1I3DVD5_9RHOB|nr:amino acid ABC transporter permease [Paracoccus aminovorans]CQR86920.1 general L-amino acid transport system permease [Paracoccus aminovorans]SFH90441.1 general L-amino acid transport system permease protein [Paracoccus aminovorans]
MAALSPSPTTSKTYDPSARMATGDWLKRNLFGSVGQSLLTIATAAILLRVLWFVLSWGVFDAVWYTADPDVCRAASGACWAVIVEKHRPMLFGLYPYDQHWRLVIMMAVYLATVVISLWPRFWNLRFLVPLWIFAALAIGILMFGGVFGLRYVPTSEWGGLPLTMLLFTGTVLIGMPIAVLLALGRRAPLPVARGVSVVFIEALRGVPLITILFVAVNVFPLFLPAGVEVNKLLRITIGIAIFFACYQAEVIRGGLQAIPRGQYEAAASLSLSYWQTTRRIILPQALRICLPAITNHIIAAMKNTSFVIIIGLFDILTATTAVMQDPLWRQFYVEAYLFVAGVYLFFGYALSRYARQVEKWIAEGRI